MNKSKTIRLILTFLICFNILGLETNFIFIHLETKNNFFFQPDKENLIQYGGTSFFEGGNGIATDVINWINISKAIEQHIDVLETNTNDERIAIIDTGLDDATWVYYNNLYGDWVNLQLIDYDGTNLTRETKIDRRTDVHHGTMITSLMVQLLQSYADQEIEAGITMFIAGQYGRVDAIVIEDHLQDIINWNDDHSTGKFKVISMSFDVSYNNYFDYFADEIDTLVNDQDCIVISIPGNADTDTLQTPEQAYQYENLKTYPASDNDVFGVGMIYGSAASTSSNEVYKVGLNISEPTQSLYVGSRYFENEGTSYAIVDIVAPGFEILLKCDNNNNGTVGNYTDTGTSYAAPQVAVAAYLASRIRYKAEPNDPLTKYEFLACIIHSSENDPSGRTAPAKLQWSKIAKPTDNLGTYTTFYSYRVGYGSLDVGDMLEYIASLS